MQTHKAFLAPGIGIATLTFLVVPAKCVAQRGLTDIPVPDPIAEQAAMRVAESATVNLFASDPDLCKPIQINFDCDGGLWIASSEIYPQIKPGQEANDKIVVLRDTDRDGAADRRTVFADGLLIPTGVVPDGPHAAFVAEGTRLLHLVDTDRDGSADQRHVVLSGFGIEDTHHLIHTLRWGPDGCLYFNQSVYIHSSVETALGTRRLDGGGIWRFRPATRPIVDQRLAGKLEVFCRGFLNPWGHAMDHLGESFATDGAYFEGINYVFPTAVFVASPGATRWVKGLNRGSPKYCGLEVLSGTHIPPGWQGDLVTNDFRSHRVCRFTVRPADSGYISRQQPEIITTQHVAFRPVDARMGPDGALYIADWYNPIIQHGEVDFRDPRRDHEHGRIWRVSFPDRPADPWPEFAAQSVPQLLQLLEDPSLAVRQLARQELWKRASPHPDKIAEAMTGWSQRGDACRLLERSWLGEVIGIASSAQDLEDLPRLPIEARRPYLRSCWRRRWYADRDVRREIEAAALTLTANEDPRVRLEAIVCAGQLDPLVHPGALDAVLRAGGRNIDPNLDFAIWQSLRQLDQAFPDGSILASRDWAHSQQDLARAVTAIGTTEAAEPAVRLLESGQVADASLDAIVEAIALSGDSSQLGRTVQSLLSTGDPGGNSHFTLARMKPLLDRTLRDGSVPQGIGPLLAKVAERSELNDERISVLAKMASVWKVRGLRETLVAVLPRTRGKLRSRVIDAIHAYDSDRTRPASERPAVDAGAKTWKLTPQRSAEILTLVKTIGSAARGESIYRREKLQCIRCHAIGSGGGLVGPNLISIGGSSQPDYILESLLDPNAKLKEGYTTRTVVTDDGAVIHGILIAETEQRLHLRLADGKQVQVAVDAIEHQKPGKSLMPEGLLDALTKEELVHLTAFLAALGRDPAFTVSTDSLVRSFDSLVQTDEASRRLERTSIDAVVSDDPAMQWRSLTAKVDGTIPLDELDRFTLGNEPTSWVRFTIEMPTAGIARLKMPVSGIKAWVDSRPTPASDWNALRLEQGQHKIVLAIDRGVCTEPFPIAVDGDVSSSQ